MSATLPRGLALLAGIVCLSAVAGEQHYNDYMRYLTGCQYYFVDETLDVSLVTYEKP